MVASIFKNFQPWYMILRVKLRIRLNEVPIKNEKDPSTLFDKISVIHQSTSNVKINFKSVEK